MTMNELPQEKWSELDFTNPLEAIWACVSTVAEDLRGDRDPRTIGRFEKGEVFVDTCFTSDTGRFETAIKDHRYHDALIIVSEYKDAAAAKAGHEAWVAALTTMPPPPAILDVHLGCTFPYRTRPR